MALDLSAFDEAMGLDHSGETVVDRLTFADSLDIPFQLTEAEAWANYTNDDLYEMDKKVREYLAKSRYSRLSKGGMRTSGSLVFAWIFGRQPTPADGQATRLIHTLLRYYCTKYSGASSIGGKHVKAVYHFNKYSATKKRPYSLRLRMELEQNERTFAEYGTNRDKRYRPRSKDSNGGACQDGGCGQEG